MTPEGWQRRTLAEIAELSGGSTPSKTIQDFWDGDICWATPSDITSLPLGEISITDTASRITERAVEKTSLRILHPECVLMTSRATIGEAVVNRVPMATNQGFCNFIPGRSLDATFLAYWLRSSKSNLISLAGGSTFLEIGKRSLRGLEICLPPLPEQKKIASILGSVDEAIQATQAVIDQTRKVKQGLLAQLLTRGIGHTRFKKTEIGEIPEEWDCLTLDECVVKDAPICYGILMPGRGHANGVPVVKVKDLKNGRVDEDALLLTDPVIDKQYSRSRLAGGDILLSIRGTTGRVAVVPPSLAGANITQDTVRIRVKPDLLSAFVYYSLQAPHTHKRIVLHTIGQAVKGINVAEVRRLLVPIPTLEEQKRIVEHLRASDEQQQYMYDAIERLLALKRGLMQDLLTGRVRVKGAA